MVCETCGQIFFDDWDARFHDREYPEHYESKGDKEKMTLWVLTECAVDKDGYLTHYLSNIGVYDDREKLDSAFRKYMEKASKWFTLRVSELHLNNNDTLDFHIKLMEERGFTRPIHVMPGRAEGE